MNGRHVVLALAGCAAAIVSMPAVSSPAFAQHKMGNMSDKQIIASALRAAPRSVAKGAAVVAVNPDGSMRVVRKARTASPASPTIPPRLGQTPCAATRTRWIGRRPGSSTRRRPPTRSASSTCSEGGTDASNTDPYAEKPTSGNHWVKTGPHVMVVGASAMMEGYPRSADPDTSNPYVMWAGTPYEHLMIPIR